MSIINQSHELGREIERAEQELQRLLKRRGRTKKKRAESLARAAGKAPRRSARNQAIDDLNKELTDSSTDQGRSRQRIDNSTPISFNLAKGKLPTSKQTPISPNTPNTTTAEQPDGQRDSQWKRPASIRARLYSNIDAIRRDPVKRATLVKIARQHLHQASQTQQKLVSWNQARAQTRSDVVVQARIDWTNRQSLRQDSGHDRQEKTSSVKSVRAQKWWILLKVAAVVTKVPKIITRAKEDRYRRTQRAKRRRQRMRRRAQGLGTDENQAAAAAATMNLFQVDGATTSTKTTPATPAAAAIAAAATSATPIFADINETETTNKTKKQNRRRQKKRKKRTDVLVETTTQEETDASVNCAERPESDADGDNTDDVATTIIDTTPTLQTTKSIYHERKITEKQHIMMSRPGSPNKEIIFRPGSRISEQSDAGGSSPPSRPTSPKKISSRPTSRQSMSPLNSPGLPRTNEGRQSTRSPTKKISRPQSQSSSKQSGSSRGSSEGGLSRDLSSRGTSRGLSLSHRSTPGYAGLRTRLVSKNLDIDTDSDSESVESVDRPLDPRLFTMNDYDWCQRAPDQEPLLPMRKNGVDRWAGFEDYKQDMQHQLMRNIDPLLDEAARIAGLFGVDLHRELAEKNLLLSNSIRGKMDERYKIDSYIESALLKDKKRRTSIAPATGKGRGGGGERQEGREGREGREETKDRNERRGKPGSEMEKTGGGGVNENHFNEQLQKDVTNGTLAEEERLWAQRMMGLMSSNEYTKHNYERVTKSFAEVCQIRKQALQHTSILILDAVRARRDEYFAAPKRPAKRPTQAASPHRAARIFQPSDTHPPPSKLPAWIPEPYNDRSNVSTRERDRLREVPPGYDPYFAMHVKERLKDLVTMDRLIDETLMNVPKVDLSKPLCHFV
jgi:hypothetical protein